MNSPEAMGSIQSKFSCARLACCVVDFFFNGKLKQAGERERLIIKLPFSQRPCIFVVGTVIGTALCTYHDVIDDE